MADVIFKEKIIFHMIIGEGLFFTPNISSFSVPNFLLVDGLRLGRIKLSVLFQLVERFAYVLNKYAMTSEEGSP